MSPIDAAVKVADDRLHWVAVIRRQPTNGRYGSKAGNGEVRLPSPQLPSGEFQPAPSALFGATNDPFGTRTQRSC